MTPDQSNDVGYRRPPKANQFQKGQSGNPSGRPKGSKNFSARINAALSETVTIDQNGKSRKISKLDLAVTQLANKAAGGDRHAMKLIMELLHQAEDRDDSRTSTSVTPDERIAQDAALLASLRLKVFNLSPEAVNVQ